MMPVLKLIMPSSVYYLFQTYSWFNFEIPGVTDYFKQELTINTLMDQTLLAPNYNFHKMGSPTRLFLANIAGVISFIIVAAFIVPLISILKLLLPTNTYISQADDFIRGRFLITLANLTLLKLPFLTYLNLAVANTTSMFLLSNTLAAYIALSYQLFLLSYYCF